MSISRWASILLLGGLAGSVLGVWLFTLLKRLGQIELTISLLYVLLLGTLGALMVDRERAHAAAPAPARRRAAASCISTIGCTGCR